MRRSTNEFDPRSYWEERLGRDWAIQGVGLRDHGRRFNEYLYEIRRGVLSRQLMELGLRVEEAAILDIGSGTGFYVDFWEGLGARSVTGSDITEAAVRNLRTTRPATGFLQFDISEPLPTPAPGPFDIASAYDVFFHIVDDQRFEQALTNVAALLHPGGWLLCSDALLSSAMRTRPSPEHVRWRHLDDVGRLLEIRGFRIRDIRPVFVLMNDPIDTDSRIRRAIWSATSALIRQGEWAGGLVGSLLSPLERRLVLSSRPGPGVKMLAAQLDA